MIFCSGHLQLNVMKWLHLYGNPMHLHISHDQLLSVSVAHGIYYIIKISHRAFRESRFTLQRARGIVVAEYRALLTSTYSK